MKRLIELHGRFGVGIICAAFSVTSYSDYKMNDTSSSALPELFLAALLLLVAIRLLARPAIHGIVAIWRSAPYPESKG